jgi:hypothetical protein
LSQVLYTGPLAGVVTPDGTQFPKGVPITVSDELAASLLLQTFIDATAAPAATTATTDATTTTTTPATSFTAPAAVPAPDPTPAPAPTPAQDPAPVVSDPTPAPAPDQTATVLAPVSGVTA